MKAARMRGVIAILWAVLWLALPGPALAGWARVGGQRDPELQAAVGDWLSGNERDALPALAAGVCGGGG